MSSAEAATPVGVLLLVEDDPDHAFLVRRRLQEIAHLDLAVVHLSTAADAVRRIWRGDVRCVVLDLSLPDASGLEAVHAVRGAGPEVPVVVLTGLDSDELGRQAVQAGAQDYLVKGRHGPEAVGRAVVFALERSQRQHAEQQQALLADRLAQVLEASAEGICGVDEEGRLSFLNRAAAALLGAQADELLGRPLHDFHDCERQSGRGADAWCPLAAGLVAGDLSDAGEQAFRSTDGTTRVLEVRARPVPLPGQAGGLVVNLADVTERRAAQTALAEREAQLVEAQELARLGSWEHDLDSGTVEWSDELFHLTGLRRDEVPPDTASFDAYLSRVPGVDRDEARRLFTGWDAVRPPVSVLHRLVRDGQERWFQCRASATVDALTLVPTRVVGTIQDVTEQKVAEDALAHQALHDALTGLPNRALLLDRLERALAGVRHGVVAVVFLDLDRFKWVNDSLSHAAGDELLVAVAQRLSAGLRPQDTLARFGGDEFVLVCEGLRSEGEAFDVVQRMTGLLARPFTLEGGRELVVTASMGLALAPAGSTLAPELLIRDADTAMYRAKERGRARCEVFDDEMRHRATARLEVQQELQLALLSGQVQPWYQPVVDLHTGRVVGCEALARWVHPTRSVLLPSEFIPHAEETGLVVPLGTAVLQAACHQVAAWNRDRPVTDQLTVSVNVSAKQLASGRLVETVAAALGESGLDPVRLCLELTETVVMDDVETSGRVLGQVRRLGVRTGVDDFGTGYSSLAYLMSLPLDLLKVDRSFVAALDAGDSAAGAIVRAVVALADALGLGVVAEGVETTEQLAALRALGVPCGQGFLWGRAVPADAAEWSGPDGLRPAVPSPRRVAAPQLAHHRGGLG